LPEFDTVGVGSALTSESVDQKVNFWLASTFTDYPGHVFVFRLSGQGRGQGRRSNKHVCVYSLSFKF